MFVDGDVVIWDLFAIGLTTDGKLYANCHHTSFWRKDVAEEAKTFFLHQCIKHGAEPYTLRIHVVEKILSLEGIGED